MGFCCSFKPAALAVRRGSDGTSDEIVSNNPRPSKQGHRRLLRSKMAAERLDIPGAPDQIQDPAGYLRSIHAVREQSRFVYDKLLKNELKHFDVDMSKMEDVASYVSALISRDFGSDYSSIPAHGRWQHYYESGKSLLDELLASWHGSIDDFECTRRILDLFFVSVLVDAGAGNKWKYTSRKSNSVFRRSEGLAIASLEMLEDGLFSEDQSQRFQVNGPALKRLDVDTVAQGFQVSPDNPMDGLSGRSDLLLRLGSALDNEKYFGQTKRPGNILDYLLQKSTRSATGVCTVALPVFWDALMDGLGPVWPATRTKIKGVSIGDAWPCSVLKSDPKNQCKNIVPFHKLTQWLAYSLMVPMEKIAKLKFVGVDLMTGLPEYRNGGLFVDTGLLTLKPEDLKRGYELYHENSSHPGQPNVEVVPAFYPDDDVIVEWRAATVGLLDSLLLEVNRALAEKQAGPLNLPQLLEAGSWKGGREISEVSRPNTKGPPIMIISDGTVF